jgi:hypothetical protein
VPCPEESVAFDTTKNLFVEGDNLEVLKLLYKAYAGKVKLIYIDPPYNTGQDFIYPDNFADPLAAYLQMTGQQDAAGNLLTSNPETSGRYHSAWLSMMFPRLFLARQLLRDDGVIFVSIDDHEVHHLRMLMNELFGEENFIATVIWEKVFAPKPAAKTFSTSHDYLLVYAKLLDSWEMEMEMPLPVPLRYSARLNVAADAATEQAAIRARLAMMLRRRLAPALVAHRANHLPVCHQIGVTRIARHRRRGAVEPTVVDDFRDPEIRGTLLHG